jgi:hypothetical protein
MHRSLLHTAALMLALAACAHTPPQEAAPAPGSAPAAAPAEGASSIPGVKVDPADQTCSSAADCAIAATQCSCDCGSPVNRKHVTKYADAVQRLCKDYHGMMCKMACDETATCDHGVCRMIKP